MKIYSYFGKNWVAAQASMLEIYNEEVKDLLGKGPPAGKKHQVSHDERGVTSVTFIESVDCKRPERALLLPRQCHLD